MTLRTCACSSQLLAFVMCFKISHALLNGHCKAILFNVTDIHKPYLVFIKVINRGPCFDFISKKTSSRNQKLDH